MTLLNRVLSTLLGTLLLPWTAFAALSPGSIPREEVEADGNREHPCLALSMFQSTRDKANRVHKAHLWMMDERFMNVREALDGIQNTGVPLVGLDGQELVPAARTDDVGLSYVVPWLVRHTHLDLEQAVHAFLAGVVILGVTLGFLGCCFLYRSWGAYAVAFVGFCLLAFVSLKVKDVYVVQVGLATGVVPWCLYLSKRGISQWVFWGFLFLGGITIGAAHSIRAHSGTAVLSFLVCLLLFSRELERRHKLVALTLLLAGVVIFPLHMHRLVVRRDAYLASHQPGYVPPGGIHPFWHPIYLGFSYLSNSYVPAFRDELAVAKVCSVAPNVPYVSDEYERILRREVFTLIKDHPGFAALTLAAKSVVVFFFLLAGANLGLVAALLHPKPWWIEFGFACAMAFSALFGILVMPIRPYLLGFFTFAALYGILSICYAIQCGALGRQVQIIRNLLAKKSNARIVSSAILLPQCSSMDRLVAGAEPKGEAHRFEESTSGKRSGPV